MRCRNIIPSPRTAAWYDKLSPTFVDAISLVDRRPPRSCPHADYPSAIAVSGNIPADEARQLAELPRVLRARGVITDYSQAALLLHGIRERACGHYLSVFADAGGDRSVKSDPFHPLDLR